MNTQEGNKLIAEFMGATFIKGKHNTYCQGIRKVAFNFDPSIRELRYDKSWDWLMPVIEKIMDMEGQNYEFIMKNTYFAVYDNRKKKYLIEKCHFYEGYPRIRAAWVTVVQFIQYLNEMEKTRSVFKSPEESPFLYKRREYYV